MDTIFINGIKLKYIRKIYIPFRVEEERNRKEKKVVGESDRCNKNPRK